MVNELYGLLLLFMFLSLWSLSGPGPKKTNLSTLFFVQQKKKSLAQHEGEYIIPEMSF